MGPTRRQQYREQTRREIKALAWEQIAVEGAPALSLRAIARAMGMTAPALYRYYPSRDDLVTELIVDAYSSLAESLEAGREEHPAGDPAGQLLAVGLSYRKWAVTYPQRYALIFGTPLSGYEAPVEVTLPAARRALAVLMESLGAAVASGSLHLTPPYSTLPANLLAQFAAWRRQDGLQVPEPLLNLTLILWGLVHGLVSIELDGHLDAMLQEPQDFYRRALEAFIQQFRN